VGWGGGGGVFALEKGLSFVCLELGLVLGWGGDICVREGRVLCVFRVRVRVRVGAGWDYFREGRACPVCV